MIPEYINCQNEEILVCDYYMCESCPETCEYVKDIRGFGCGAMMIPPGQLEKEIEDGSKD